jgi:hypothetical protein
MELIGSAYHVACLRRSRLRERQRRALVACGPEALRVPGGGADADVRQADFALLAGCVLAAGALVEGDEAGLLAVALTDC